MGPWIDHRFSFSGLMQVHALSPGMRAYDAAALSRWQSEADVHEQSPT